MNIRKRGFSLLVITLLIISFITGCSGKDVVEPPKDTGSKPAETIPETKPEVAEEKVLRWASLAAPSGEFNPLLKTDDYNAYITGVIFESLVNLSPEMEFEGLLAKSWEVSEDSKSVVFHLREGVKWHDGEPFTADDVKFTYEFIADPEYTGVQSSQISEIKGVKERKEGTATELEGVEVIDPYTIRITTGEVYAPFLANISSSIAIIPKHIWSKVAMADVDSATELLRNPIGTGPFKMSEFVPDRYTIVEKNTDYWNGEAKLDKIVFQVVNPETVLAQMLNDELDYLEIHTIDPDDIKMYKDAGFTFEEVQTTSYQMMVPNNQDPIINNKWLRQALTYAIDRQGIVDTILHGFGNVGTQIYPPHFWAYPGDSEINMYEYNPEEAIKLLTEKLGWEYKNNKMLMAGKPVKFKLIYPSGNKARELSAPIIQENLKKIGIEMDIEMMEFATMLEKLANQSADAFEFSLLGIGLGTDPDATKLLHSDYIFNGLNFSRYSNPELDKLLDEGMRYLDIEQRRPIYKEVSKLINEEMPNIYLYNFNYGMIKSPKLKGKNPHPNSFSYNAVNWSME